MTNQTCSATAIAIEVINGTASVLSAQGADVAIGFLNSEMVTLMNMIIDGEIDHDTGHAAYKVLRNIRGGSANGFKLTRMLNEAIKEALKL